MQRPAFPLLWETVRTAIFALLLASSFANAADETAGCTFLSVPASATTTVAALSANRCVVYDMASAAGATLLFGTADLTAAAVPLADARVVVLNVADASVRIQNTAASNVTWSFSGTFSGATVVLEQLALTGPATESPEALVSLSSAPLSSGTFTAASITVNRCSFTGPLGAGGAASALLDIGLPLGLHSLLVNGSAFATVLPPDFAGLFEDAINRFASSTPQSAALLRIRATAPAGSGRASSLSSFAVTLNTFTVAAGSVLDAKQSASTASRLALLEVDSTEAANAATSLFAGSVDISNLGMAVPNVSVTAGGASGPVHSPLTVCGLCWLGALVTVAGGATASVRIADISATLTLTSALGTEQVSPSVQASAISVGLGLVASGSISVVSSTVAVTVAGTAQPAVAGEAVNGHALGILWGGPALCEAAGCTVTISDNTVAALGAQATAMRVEAFTAASRVAGQFVMASNTLDATSTTSAVAAGLFYGGALEATAALNGAQLRLTDNTVKAEAPAGEAFGFDFVYDISAFTVVETSGNAVTVRGAALGIGMRFFRKVASVLSMTMQDDLYNVTCGYASPASARNPASCSGLLHRLAVESVSSLTLRRLAWAVNSMAGVTNGATWQAGLTSVASLTVEDSSFDVNCAGADGHASPSNFDGLSAGGWSGLRFDGPFATVARIVIQRNVIQSVSPLEIAGDASVAGITLSPTAWSGAQQVTVAANNVSIATGSSAAHFTVVGCSGVSLTLGGAVSVAAAAFAAFVDGNRIAIGGACAESDALSAAVVLHATSAAAVLPPNSLLSVAGNIATLGNGSAAARPPAEVTANCPAFLRVSVGFPSVQSNLLMTRNEASAVAAPAGGLPTFLTGTVSTGLSTRVWVGFQCNMVQGRPLLSTDVAVATVFAGFAGTASDNVQFRQCASPTPSRNTVTFTPTFGTVTWSRSPKTQSATGSPQTESHSASLSRLATPTATQTGPTVTASLTLSGATISATVSRATASPSGTVSASASGTLSKVTASRSPSPGTWSLTVTVATPSSSATGPSPTPTVTFPTVTASVSASRNSWTPSARTATLSSSRSPTQSVGSASATATSTVSPGTPTASATGGSGSPTRTGGSTTASRESWTATFNSPTPSLSDRTPSPSKGSVTPSFHSFSVSRSRSVWRDSRTDTMQTPTPTASRGSWSLSRSGRSPSASLTASRSFATASASGGSGTPSATVSSSASATGSHPPTATSSLTVSRSPTPSVSQPPTPTPLPTGSGSMSHSASRPTESATVSATVSPPPTLTATSSTTATVTGTDTPPRTASATASGTASATVSVSDTSLTGSITVSVSGSPTRASPSLSVSKPTASTSLPRTASPSNAETASVSYSHTGEVSPTDSMVESASPTSSEASDSASTSHPPTRTEQLTATSTIVEPPPLDPLSGISGIAAGVVGVATVATGSPLSAVSLAAAVLAGRGISSCGLDFSVPEALPFPLSLWPDFKFGDARQAPFRGAVVANVASAVIALLASAAVGAALLRGRSEKACDRRTIGATDQTPQLPSPRRDAAKPQVANSDTLWLPSLAMAVAASGRVPAIPTAIAVVGSPGLLVAFGPLLRAPHDDFDTALGFVGYVATMAAAVGLLTLSYLSVRLIAASAATVTSFVRRPLAFIDATMCCLPSTGQAPETTKWGNSTAARWLIQGRGGWFGLEAAQARRHPMASQDPLMPLDPFVSDVHCDRPGLSDPGTCARSATLRFRWRAFTALLVGGMRGPSFAPNVLAMDDYSAAGRAVAMFDATPPSGCLRTVSAAVTAFVVMGISLLSTLAPSPLPCQIGHACNAGATGIACVWWSVLRPRRLPVANAFSALFWALLCAAYAIGAAAGTAPKGLEDAPGIRATRDTYELALYFVLAASAVLIVGAVLEVAAAIVTHFLGLRELAVPAQDIDFAEAMDDAMFRRRAIRARTAAQKAYDEQPPPPFGPPEAAAVELQPALPVQEPPATAVEPRAPTDVPAPTERDNRALRSILQFDDEEDDAMSDALGPSPRAHPGTDHRRRGFATPQQFRSFDVGMHGGGDDDDVAVAIPDLLDFGGGGAPTASEMQQPSVKCDARVSGQHRETQAQHSELDPDDDDLL